MAKNKDDMVGKFIGNHKVLKLIGEGGFGKTYKAQEMIGGIAGGIDCLKDCSNVPKDLAYVLVNEYNAARDLRHFGLPAMRQLKETEDGKYVLIMSYIPGKTLEKGIEGSLDKGVKGCGRLDPEHVAWITERILNILKYMHFHGVVHGDLKPQNIIIQPKEHTVVLVDFGLSMVKPKSGDENMGFTELYASPEQLAGKVLIPESDLYSLGKTMIYALGGGEDAVKKLEIPDSTPEALCDFIRRLLAIDVNNRPHWGKEDLCKTIQDVRRASFGRTFSSMRPLPKSFDEEEEDEGGDKNVGK